MLGPGRRNDFVARPLHSDALQSLLELAFGIYIHRPVEHLLEGLTRFAQNEITGSGEVAIEINRANDRLEGVR